MSRITIKILRRQRLSSIRFDHPHKQYIEDFRRHNKSPPNSSPGPVLYLVSRRFCLRNNEGKRSKTPGEKGARDENKGTQVGSWIDVGWAKLASMSSWLTNVLVLPDMEFVIHIRDKNKNKNKNKDEACPASPHFPSFFL